uniref:Uncharacterized protein n=1 Tax=Wuchereria bancrofti TaxID=6293 RepID=A0AAF5Q683_WUCBA
MKSIKWIMSDLCFIILSKYWRKENFIQCSIPGGEEFATVFALWMRFMRLLVFAKC